MNTQIMEFSMLLFLTGQADIWTGLIKYMAIVGFGIIIKMDISL